MADNQIPVPNLNRIIDELMSEHRQGVEEVHLEPLFETVMNVEPVRSQQWRNHLRKKGPQKGRGWHNKLKKENQKKTKTLSLQKLRIYGLRSWRTRVSSAKEVLGS